MTHENCPICAAIPASCRRQTVSSLVVELEELDHDDVPPEVSFLQDLVPGLLRCPVCARLYSVTHEQDEIGARTYFTTRFRSVDEKWPAVCAALDVLSGADLDLAIAKLRDAVTYWPAADRRIAADSSWLHGIFDGVFDPRLALVGRAAIRHRHEYTSQDHAVRLGMMRALETLARHLDPTFEPPDVVLDEGDEIRYASGCGGGEAWQRRGNATHWLVYHNRAVEHSADMETDETWSAHGLAGAATLVIERNDYFSGSYTIAAEGDAPAVLELAPAWQAIIRGADHDEVSAILARTRVPWT